MSRAHLYIFILPIAIKNTIKKNIGNLFKFRFNIAAKQKVMFIFFGSHMDLESFLTISSPSIVTFTFLFNVYKVVFLHFQSMSHKTDKFEKKLTKSHQFHLIILRSWHREIHFSFKY